MHDETLRDFRRRAGLSQAAAAKLSGCSLRTFKRYEAAPTPPAGVLRLLQYAAGYLPNWPGFRIDGPELITPDGTRLHRNQLEAWHYAEILHREKYRSLQSKIAELEASHPRNQLAAFLVALHPAPDPVQQEFTFPHRDPRPAPRQAQRINDRPQKNTSFVPPPLPCLGLAATRPRTRRSPSA